MNFKTIYESVMNKCNVDIDDEQGIPVIKLGINEAYSEIAKIEGLSAKSPVPIINGVVSLPDDLIEIKNIDPKLNVTDKIDGSRIYTSHKGTLTLTYSYLPEDLTNDKDEPEISLKYHKLLITYGCYAYYQFKKKDAVANSYLNSFMRALNNFNVESNPTMINGVFSL